MRIKCLGVLILLLQAAALQAEAPCPSHNPQRNVFFGDLHVHTAFSLDANVMDTYNTPFDAYRFARGAALGIQPYDEEDRPLRTIQLRRPLDFAAVTDHAELLGEVRICTTPGVDGHRSLSCRLYRNFPRAAFFLMNQKASLGKRHRFCGKDGSHCRQVALAPWQDIQAAAQHANDPCHFTTFVGYEWTGNKDDGNIHRNVIFRNDQVPEYPLGFSDSITPQKLWRWLQAHCHKAGTGCDALVIPHNSNLSRGYMFPPLSTATPEEEGAMVRQLRLRAYMEPLVEVIQHKGDSECFPNAYGVILKDELCAFEKLPYESFRAKFFDRSKKDDGSYPVAPSAGFVREVLREGLRQQERFGANAYHFGFIGSTDTHLATPGAVEESERHPGHGGAGKPMRKPQPRSLPDDVEFNPGGLAAVWAQENTRASLFDALRRRESYATSGPRIQLRFFGGWGYPQDLCSRADLVSQGYQGGVPMGATLPNSPAEGAAPRFALAAWMDPGDEQTAGVPLQRIQIIKGWVDEEGRSREQLYDAASSNRAATVDTRSCVPEGAGAAMLCAVWEDPDFQPGRDAYYYARAVENPSCRWHTRVCNAMQVDCDHPKKIDKSLRSCCDANIPRVIQERALSSPIWYYAPSSGANATPAGS